MIAGLRITPPTDRALRVVALGAHADDIEIGAGGLIQRLVADTPSLSIRWLVASATPERRREAEKASSRLVGSVSDCTLDIGDLRDGFLPFLGPAPKEWLIRHAGFEPDIVICPRGEDLHQDHRLVGQLAWQVFRSSLIFEYEIPKYEGDLGRPNVYVVLDRATAERKVATILEAFPSQRSRRWFEPETFWALLRLRGIEAASPTGFAEAFHASKIVL